MMKTRLAAIGLLTIFLNTSAFAQTEPASPDPVALAKEVRQSADWIHHVKSLHIHFEAVDNIGPATIAVATAQQKAAGQIPDPKIDPFLRRSFTSTTDLYFDNIHYRSDSQCQEDLFEFRNLWDGKKDYYFNNYKTRSPSLSIQAANYDDSAFSFLPARLNDTPGRDYTNCTKPPEPDDFQLIGKQNYRGIDCWRLATKYDPNGMLHLWFVGIADHRLYGDCAGYLTTPAEEFDNFRKVIGKDAADFKTSDDVAHWFKTAPLEKQAAASVANYDLQCRTGTPSSEDWYADYTQIQPNIWIPKQHGGLYHSNLKPGGGLVDTPYVERSWQYTATLIDIDKPLPDETFTLPGLHIPENTYTVDVSVTPSLTYKFKSKFTPEEWQQILFEAINRDLEIKRLRQQQQQRRLHKQPGNVG